MTLSQLIEALEKAPQGSRELDWRVAEYLDEIPPHRIIPVGWDYCWYRSSETVYALWRATDSEGRSVELWQAPEVTTSVDAALKLVSQALPGWRICFEAIEGIAADLYILGPLYRDNYPERESSPPISGKPIAMALVLSTLKALQARGDA